MFSLSLMGYKWPQASFHQTSRKGNETACTRLHSYQKISRENIHNHQHKEIHHTQKLFLKFFLMGHRIGIFVRQNDSIPKEVTVHMKVLPFELNLWRRQMLQKGREMQKLLGPSAGTLLVWPLTPQSAHSLSHFYCLH